jgi:hypothetical protein
MPARETGDGSRSEVRGFRNFELRIAPVSLGLPVARETPAHVFSILPVAFQRDHSVSSVFMDLSQLSQEQFKELVRGIVDDRLRELLGDPDLGLQLGDGLRTRLKESLSSAERLSGEDIADQLGLRW